MAESAPAQDDQELLRTDQQAEAALDQVKAPPAKVTKLRRKGPRPPAGLDEPVIEFGATLKNISLGKPIANVNTTLTFDLDVPQPGIGELMGEHAYTGVFAGGFLGEGVFIKEAPRKVDADNRVTEQVKVTMPRFDSANKDQIERCILPLITSDQAVLDALRALMTLEGSWRLNCPVDITGALRLHVQQQSFDLTKKATTEAEDKAATEARSDAFADVEVDPDSDLLPN